MDSSAKTAHPRPQDSIVCHIPAAPQSNGDKVCQDSHHGIGSKAPGDSYEVLIGEDWAPLLQTLKSLEIIVQVCYGLPLPTFRQLRLLRQQERKPQFSSRSNVFT